VLVEQYIDFVVDRTFRESLLVHAERKPQIQYNPDRNRVGRFHVAAYVPPADEPTRLDNSRQEYQEADGATLFTNDPGIKAALDELSARWPWTLSRHELVDAVHARLVSAGLTPSAGLPDLVDDLLGVLILQGQARYRLDPVSPGPVAAPLRLEEATRRMVELTGNETQASTFNVWHETHMLSPLDRYLLPLLDGTRDRNALVAALLAAVRANAIPIERDGKQLSGEADMRGALADYIDGLPQHLTEMKLLRVG
jgi:methyltransferase-like protein